MTNLENALAWLYVKTWGKFGEHVIKEDIWNFSANDLETAVMSLAYPRKRKAKGKDKSERLQALTDLIMEKFETGGIPAFRDWAGEIHDQVIETLPETDELSSIDKQVMISEQQQRTLVKIVKWDTGKYSRSIPIFEIE